MFIEALGFGLVSASILAVAAVGFTFQFATTNVLNLAYGTIMTSAAFIAYACNAVGINIWLALPIGGVFGALASAALNRGLLAPFLKRGTPLFNMVLVTVAVGLILQHVIQAVGGATIFSYRMQDYGTHRFGGIVLTGVQIGIIILSVAIMAALHWLLQYTRLGRAMRATAANRKLARTCGIMTERVIDIAWLLSGFFCGIAGVCLAMSVYSLTSSLGDGALLAIIATAALGGIGSPYGAMLGAIVVGMASEVVAGLTNPLYREVVAFGILALVLLIRPTGLIPSKTAGMTHGASA
ncbi:MAG: branched-chain amino acid ABC transporter permease [Candidatus Dormibacteraeota bacterium]|nr:branched-chain amino acid ABC transporter permease [Candidatus Dormibacteraeota bacterium]